MHACHVPVCQWEEATPYFGAPTPFWSSCPRLEISRLQARHISNKLIDRLRGWERAVSKSVSERFSAFIHEKELVQPNHCTVVCI